MGMPIIQSSDTTREQSITDMIESVALEQTALSHILNAEGKKIQKFLKPCSSFTIEKENHLQDYDFVYEGELAYTGLNEQGHAFVVFKLTDASIPIDTNVYCIDVNTFIEVGDHYEQIILQGSADLSEDSANRIRNILLQSFPYISLASLQALSGIPSLTQSQAVTATQLAIWKLSNDFSMTHSNSNVMQLYNWYLLLEPKEIIINPAEINFSAEPIDSDDFCGVVFSFSTDGVNNDSTPIPLSYTFDKDIVSEYGAVVTETSSDGITYVTVTHIPADADFNIIVSGTQYLPYDAYRYVNAQDLVGLFSETNYMSAQCDFLCIGNCDVDVIQLTKSVNSMVNSIASLEIVLQSKLRLFKACLCDNKEQPCEPPIIDNNLKL